MTSQNATPSRDIDGKGRTVRELLAGRKYSIDFYQREYKWGTKQVKELLEDLAIHFLRDHDSAHERSAVARYRHYFLGSIIVSDKEGQKFVVDGQQRLTTLTLLLIALHHKLDDKEQKGQIQELICSQHFGERSFNLDIPERTACMEALYTHNGEEYLEADPPESVSNLLARYADIEEHFPSDCDGDTLPYFLDWLIEKVHLVEITAYSDHDAYTIFETMNDRGLSLTPADMLKGYLLANIDNENRRNRANGIWKKRVQSLSELGKEADAGSIKSWLRSQYARSIRERTSGAHPQDFDLIGTEFHRWVRDNEEYVGLDSSDKFYRFIERDFAFYGHWYERLRHAANTLIKGLESVHFNNLTLQYPVLLAPLRADEDEETSLRKIRTTAVYLDIVVHRRIWNFQSITSSTMQYAMFQVMRKIRGMALAELVATLRKQLDEVGEPFIANENFQLHRRNRPHVHRLLARITDFVGVQSGQASRYEEYIQGGEYEIEHIWANHFENHRDEFGHSSEFQEYRDRIGGLLLLPKKFNASYGDLSYEEKRPHYLGQNLLAQSLHEQAYQRNPGFTRFIEKSGLRFEPHPAFRRADLDSRQNLYRELAELIWHPTRIEHETVP